MARKPEPLPRPSKVTIPERCNPLAKLVFAEMRRQNVTYFEMELRSSVLMSTFKAWRNEKNPGLLSIEACLGALGWALVPVPIKPEMLSAKVHRRIQRLCKTFRNKDEALAAAILATSAMPDHLRKRFPRLVRICPETVAAEQSADAAETFEGADATPQLEMAA